MDTELLIGDRTEAGAEAAEPILNPRTGATILEVAEASPAQVDAAVAAARAAFDGWSRTTPAERSAALLRIAARIEAEAEDFAAAGGAELRQAAGRRPERRDARPSSTAGASSPARCVASRERSPANISPATPR